MIKHISRRPVVIVLVVIFAGLVLLNFRVSTWRETVRDVSEMPWGGHVVGLISPTGEVLAETYYYAYQDHHFGRAFGKCEESSFKQFVTHFDFIPLEGDMFNSRLLEWVPSDKRDGFVFLETDVGYSGSIKINGERTKVQGAYSKETGYFLMEFIE